MAQCEKPHALALSPCQGLRRTSPNRIGVSCCDLISVKGLRLTVCGLDAIHGTPVLDVKPYFREFGPRSEVLQPEWVSEVMSEYYAG